MSKRSTKKNSRKRIETHNYKMSKNGNDMDKRIQALNFKMMAEELIKFRDSYPLEDYQLEILNYYINQFLLNCYNESER